MIIKISSSGNQVHAVATENIAAGTVLVCAKSILLPVLYGDKAFVSLDMFPKGTDPSKFPQSKVLLPDEGYVKISIEEAQERGIIPGAASGSRGDALQANNAREQRNKSSFMNKPNKQGGANDKTTNDSNWYDN